MFAYAHKHVRGFINIITYYARVYVKIIISRRGPWIGVAVVSSCGYMDINNCTQCAYCITAYCILFLNNETARVT